MTTGNACGNIDVQKGEGKEGAIIVPAWLQIWSLCRHFELNLCLQIMTFPPEVSAWNIKGKNHLPCWSLGTSFLLSQIQHLRGVFYTTFAVRIDSVLSFLSSPIPGIAFFCHSLLIPLDFILFTFIVKSKKAKLDSSVSLCKHQMKGRMFLSYNKHCLSPPSTLPSYNSYPRMETLLDCTGTLTRWEYFPLEFGETSVVGSGRAVSLLP